MNMRILQIGEEGSECLRKTAKELTVEAIKSPEIQQIVENMKKTMRTAPGVGLAAPQIGESLKIIVIEDLEKYQAALNQETREERGRKPIDYHVMFNPVLDYVTFESLYFFEGCLSVKGCMRITPRVEAVRVKYLDELGDLRQIEAKGWYARILQHEIDHLNGRLYIDIADACTEVKLENGGMTRWINATRNEIWHHYQQCLAEKNKNESTD